MELMARELRYLVSLGFQPNEAGRPAYAGRRMRLLKPQIDRTKLMTISKSACVSIAALSLALCLGSISQAADPNSEKTPARGADLQAQPQPRPEAEQQRKEAEQQAEKTLDKDAIAAIEETRSAIKAIADNKIKEALATIERATGKIDVLVARSPAKSLVPVNLAVEAIELAPADIPAIRSRASAAEKAVRNKDYPEARLLLAGLTSEIRVRTYNLPVATYPVALKDAARLLDQNKTKEASRLLSLALSTLVIVDRVIPLPIALAQTAVEEARDLRDKNKEGAVARLDRAKKELERGKELGYAGHDPEYASLDKTISDLEKELRGTKDTASAFSKLTERLSSFFKRQSETERRTSSTE
jgi:hypothetical protein